MPDNKTYRFNVNGVCTNPEKELIVNSHPFYFEIELARFKGFWGFGYRYEQRGLTEGSGIGGQGVWKDWIEREAKNYNQCKLEAIEVAIEYFSEPERIKRTGKILKNLMTLKNELLCLK